jgi:MerR family transcriptional regulator, light-induced transcriptional regulator
MAAGAVSLLKFADSCHRADRRTKLEVVSHAVAPSANISDRLNEAIEVHVGPRLVLLHNPQLALRPERVPSEQQIDEFARLTIDADDGAVVAYFESVRVQYPRLTILFSFFLAPAAERLGELWRLDECNFVDVTIGVGRLQALMDRVASEETFSDRDAGRHALLIALPGETHVFGIQMVARFLESTGWSVVQERGRTVGETSRTVAEEWIDVVGLTVSSVSRIELAAATIGAIRRCSANSGIGIMVGGAAFMDNPELVTRVGADAAGFDAPTAILLASHLLRRQSASG